MAKENMKLIKKYMCIYLLLQVISSVTPVYSAEHVNKTKSDRLIDTFSFSELPDEFGGCSCSFNLNSSDEEQEIYMFFSEVTGDQAWMKIAGTLVNLKPASARSNIGFTLYKKYTAEGIIVNVELKETPLCPPTGECEGVAYKAKFTVRKGKMKQTVRATGGCGC